MIYLGILFVGALRIVQANCNKQTSIFLNSKERFFKYGAFFEFSAAVFSFLYLCLFGFQGWNTVTLVCSILAASCFVAELITSLEAMKGAPLVLCNMCALGGGIILPSIAAIFFFDEPLTFLQWLGVAVFFAAAYFLSPDSKQKASKSTDNSDEQQKTLPSTGLTGEQQKVLSAVGKHPPTAKITLILLLNFCINGVCSTVGKYFAVRVPNGNVPLYSFLTYGISSLLFACLLLLLYRKNLTNSIDRKSLRLASTGSFRHPLPRKLYIYGTILGATCSTIVCTGTALSRTVPVVIMNTIPSAISIIGCLFIGRLIFQEKISIKNVLGVLLGILSVAMIV